MLRRLAILAVVSSLAACSSTPAAAPSASPSPTSNPHVLRVRTPIGLTVASGLIWVASADGNEIIGFDPRDGKQLRRIDVGRTPLRLAARDSVIWASVFRAGKVVSVDGMSASTLSNSDAGGGPEGIVVAGASVWVVRQDAGVLTRMDVSGKVLRSTPIPGTPRLVDVDETHAWVTSFGTGALTRVEITGAGTAKTTGKLCDGAQGVAVHKGVVWVTCTRDDEVIAVDAKTLKVLGRVEVDGEPDAIRVLNGRLFVVATKGPTLVELSTVAAKPAVLSSRVLGTADLLADKANVDLALAGGRIWVSSYLENAVYSVNLAG